MAEVKEELEIERKWIVINPPRFPDDLALSNLKITQMYLVNENAERVRMTEHLDETIRYYHTLKRPAKKQKGQWEKEREVDPLEFHELLGRVDTSRQAIIKTRTVFKLGKLKYELDRFVYPVEFSILEVEVDDIKADVPIPDFLGEVIEVTGVDALSNYRIAKSYKSATKKVDSLIAAHLEKEKVN